MEASPLQSIIYGHALSEAAFSVVESGPVDDLRDIWFQRLSSAADILSRGQFHVAFVIASAALILSFRWRHQKGSPVSDTHANRVQVAILHGCFTLGLVASTALSFTLAIKEHHGWTHTLIPVYILVLQIIRLILSAHAAISSELRHHTNSLLAVDLLLSGGSVLLPGLIAKSTLRISSVQTSRIVVLLITVAIAFITPRSRQRPVVSFELSQRPKGDIPSPEETCSAFSYFMSYGWMTSIVLQGCRRTLSLNDLPELPYYDEPLVLLRRVRAAHKRGKTALATVLFLLHSEILKMMFFAIATACTELIAPISMYNLLRYLDDPETAILRPSIWVALLFVGPMSRSISFQQYIFNSTRLIVRTKVSLVQLIYDITLRSLIYGELQEGVASAKKEKADESLTEHEDPEATSEEELKTADTRVEKSAAGRILNLTSYDIDGITNSRDIVLVCTAGPIELLFGTMLLYRMLGWIAFVGLGIMVLSLPLPSVLSQYMSKAQRGVMTATDARIGMVSEYLSSVRIIKYFAWEPYMIRRVDDARKAEQRLIWRRSLYAISITVFGDFIPLFSLFAMFAIYTVGQGHVLTSSVAFTSLSVIELLRQQFTWMSNVTRFIAQMVVACQRFNNFFTTTIEQRRPPDGPPAFTNATIRRTPTATFKLQSLNVQFTENALNVIVGPSGSGKTSLILSLLGETVLEAGIVTCPRDVGYASQTAWLQNVSIRENILFNSPFDEKKYWKIANACCLLPDFRDLEFGDLTEVGENGTALSGGQRQRVAVARAIYSSSSLLLLDDIFSALDAPTQEMLYNRCFNSDLLEGRTIILVTQLGWIASKAHTVVSMLGGQVVSVMQRVGDDTVQPSSSDVSSSTHSIMESGKNHAADGTDQLTGPTQSRISQEKLIAGRIPRTLFYQYMYLFGGHKYAIAAILASALAQISFFSITLWLSVWVGAYSQDQAVNTGFYLAIYASVLASFHIMSILNNLSFERGAWHAARTMHWRLINAIMSAPLNWLDSNPLGRIVNRFSTDMYSLDSQLVGYLRMTMDNALRLALRIVGIGSIMPIFAVPAAFVCAVGFIVGEMYTRAQLSLKQLNSATQSPVFAHIQVTLQGLSIVRARAGMAEKFQENLALKLRDFARAAETRLNCNRWVCVRADAATAIVSLCAGVIAINRVGTISASLVGFSLTNAIGLSTTILSLVRNMNELEVELNCFRRAQEYTMIEPERSVSGVENDQGLSSSWPSEGTVEFRNFAARYSIDGADVVSDVSFSVKPGQRVAIIGRTGSGKSTLALSVLGFTHISQGQVLIDDVDIRDITLQRLRSSVTIIPQEPVLFAGDVQYNLDPSQEKSKPDDIAAALEACRKVKALNHAHHSPPSATNGTISNDTNNSNNHHHDGTSTAAIASHSPEPPKQQQPQRINLSTPISEKGENFSPGQRQVLGLARAIARRSKIIILDEATASVDDETDETIQEILRTEFKGSTVIAIAHRLKSVVDYDMIVVMGNGNVLETGSPKTLFGKRGVFFDMLKHTGDFERLATTIMK